MLATFFLIYLISCFVYATPAPGPYPQVIQVTNTQPQIAANATSSPTGVISIAASATSSTASADPAQNQTWMTLTCTDPAVTDATIDPSDRWNKLGCQPAWLAAVQSASTATNVAQATWPELISNFFHGPDKMGCADLSARDGCNTNIECQDQSKGSYVPAFEILNSFVGVSSLYYNLYDSIGKAEGDIGLKMGGFSSTFAQFEPEVDVFKLVLDFVALGFALSVAPLWNDVFKNLPAFKDNGNLLGTIKDSVNPLVSNGVTIVKDSSVSGQSISAQNTLSQNAAGIVNAITATLDTLNKDLFNGSSQSVGNLYRLMDGGKALSSGFTIDDPTAVNAVEAAIFEYLIPQAWSLSNEDLHPFVIDSGKPCTDPNPVDSRYITSGIASETYSCVNGNAYYLVTASGPVTSGGGIVSPLPTSYNTFSVLPGLDSIDGKNWGGISRDDLIAAAVATYTANHNANGGPVIDPASDEAVSNIFDSGIRAPGIITIPVCSASEAYGNWIGQAKNKGKPNYPCNS